jgi:hypothetical protein
MVEETAAVTEKLDEGAGTLATAVSQFAIDRAAESRSRYAA